MADRGIPSRAQWLRRLAQRRADPVAFVLSGGGPYGALQVGAVQALSDHGIKPDILMGCSVGALNAAFLAFDPTPHGTRLLESIWRGLRETDLFPGSRVSWARFLARGNRVFDNSGIASLVAERLGNETLIEDAQIPLGIVATEQATGDGIVFTSGEIVPRILASTSMPGIYPPVEIDGVSYVDGGVADNVPIAPAVAMGARTIYVMDATSYRQGSRPLARPIDHLLHAFSLARSQRFRLEREILEKKARIVVVPMPVLSQYVPFTSLRSTPQMIDLGYESTDRFIQDGLPQAVAAGDANS